MYFNQNTMDFLKHREWHRYAYNPCCLFTPITALGLDQNISTRMPMTPAVFSLHLHDFNSARMFDVSDPAVYSTQPWLA